MVRRETAVVLADTSSCECAFFVPACSWKTRVLGILRKRAAFRKRFFQFRRRHIIKRWCFCLVVRPDFTCHVGQCISNQVSFDGGTSSFSFLFPPSVVNSIWFSFFSLFFSFPHFLPFRCLIPLSSPLLLSSSSSSSPPSPPSYYPSSATFSSLF